MLGVNGSDVLKVLVMGGPRDEGDGEVVCWVYNTENRSRTRVWKRRIALFTPCEDTVSRLLHVSKEESPP